MKYLTKPIEVTAEQWIKGKKIEGVIDQPFQPSGHWSDRFGDRPDVCIIVNGNPVAIAERDWIVTYPDGSIRVVSDKEFKKNFIIEVDGDKLSQHGFDALHDIVYDITGLNLSNDKLIPYYRQLPEEIKADARRWGLNDTVVRGNIYSFLSKQIP
jgi:hypothetical protein